MSQGISIWIMEPELAEKRGLAATKIFRASYPASLNSEFISLDDIKKRLKGIRENSRDNTSSLARQLEATLSDKYPTVRVKSAVDNVDVLNYITEISDGIKVVSTNNSSIVTRELAPLLIGNGFTVINSYFNEFNIEKQKLPDYWELPRLFDRDLRGTFAVSTKLTSLPDVETRKYLAVLGVNAISASEGTVFFLQHYSNIARDLRLANKVILIVGLEKIVTTQEEACFQTQCVGIFGMDSVLAGAETRPKGTLDIDELPLNPVDRERELHIIILDNRRSEILKSKFRDLLLCIGCRACKKQCPIHYSSTDGDFIWTPRNYLSQFIYGSSNSIDICLHCEACRRECPVDIDLPYLMWQAKMDYIAQHGRSFRHKILGKPETLAKLGTIFPITNWLMGLKSVRLPMEIITGIDRRTRLPKFHSQTFKRRFKRHG